MPNICEGSCGSATEFEVREDSLEIVDSFRYLGDVILCGGGVELAVKIGYPVLGVNGGNL